MQASGPVERLALFLPDMRGGGAERVALALIQDFLDRGHPVDLVLCSATGELLELVPEEVEIVDLGAPRLRQMLWPLIRYLRQRKPYALHAMMWPLPLVAVLARALSGVATRIVGSEHAILSNTPFGLRHRAVRMATRIAYRRLDRLVAVSDGVAHDIAALIDLPRTSLTVIHNPLLLPKNLPSGKSVADRWTASSRRLVAIGELKAEKNYALMLDALRILRERIDASLVILGNGNELDLLRRRARDLDLTHAVVFAGFETDIWPYLVAAEMFVLSSDSEGYGNVLIEAMHAGLPVVSTDCPSGPREILADGAFGTLTPCGDPAALADAIAIGLRDPHDRNDLQARAAALSGVDASQKHYRMMVGAADAST